MKKTVSKPSFTGKTVDCHWPGFSGWMTAWLVLAVFSLSAAAQVVADPGLAFRPTIRITSPANHATFYTPVDVPIYAYVESRIALTPVLGASSVDLDVTNVEFYANGVDLGSGFSLGATPIHPLQPIFYDGLIGSPILRLAPVYNFVWTNTPAGSYALTAVATGLRGVTFPLTNRLVINVTSAPVNITVTTSSTNSNPVDVVNIVATDPIAVSGTNITWTWSGVTNTTPAWTNWPPPHPITFTNWGPKDGLFTIHRFGVATSNLTVNFRISGTASNGVDYAAITNSLTIPAGKAFGLISIVPMATNNFAKTVILSLAADTNVPPAYLVGLPLRAETIILPDWPRPLPFLLPDGTFHANASGPDGAWFILQTSPDLINWTNVSTNQVFNGSADFADPGGTSGGGGYYQVVPLTNAPAD